MENFAHPGGLGAAQHLTSTFLFNDGRLKKSNNKLFFSLC